MVMCSRCHKRAAVVFMTKLENGKRYFTFEQCKKLAEVLGTSMDYLAGITDEKKPYPKSKNRS